MSEQNKLPGETEETADKDRRAFLRKSAYAVYATPVITALLVNNASAMQSYGDGKGSGGSGNPPYYDD